MGTEVAEGGRVELPDRLVAGRPRSKRVGSPRAQALQVAATDQVRTGGLRLDGATGTPLPYEAMCLPATLSGAGPVRLQGVEP